jgi:hypothetical protein
MYPTATDRKTSINLCTFQIQQNPQRISLPFTLDRIVSVRVKHICWESPIIDNSSCMLYLSCPELLTHSPAQSTILMPSGTPSNQLVHRRSLLASWVIVPQEAGVPNWNNNDPQPIINLSKLTSTNKLTFIVEDDSNAVLRETPLLAYQLVQVTLELEQLI